MLHQKVLQYLEKAESKEADPDYRDSYRLSWIIVTLANRNHPNPLLEGFYTIYGVSPSKLPEKLKQRRLAQLERWYSTFWEELPPKKPVLSVSVVSAVPVISVKFPSA